MDRPRTLDRWQCNSLGFGLCLEFGKWEVHVLSLFIVCWLVILIAEKMQDEDEVDC
jgi:hypothetical protein